MNPDLILGLVVGFLICLLVGVKAVTWAVLKLCEIVAGWFYRSL